MPIKILVADDHALTQLGFQKLAADSDLKIVGEVTDANEILDKIAEWKPDVFVSEIRVDGNDVLKSLEGFSSEATHCRIVFYSASSNPTVVLRASTIDCYDYLLKTSPVDDLLEAIVAAANGQPTPKDSLLMRAKNRARLTNKWKDVETPLTQREQQVLQHVAMGLSNREVGRSLGISVETVKEHVQHILRKMEANDRTQAAVWAVREGLI